MVTFFNIFLTMENIKAFAHNYTFTHTLTNKIFKSKYANQKIFDAWDQACFLFLKVEDRVTM